MASFIVRAYLLADFGWMQGHGFAANPGHDEGRARGTGGADGAEQVGALVRAVAHPGRARAAGRPDVGQAVLLADALSLSGISCEGSGC